MEVNVNSSETPGPPEVANLIADVVAVRGVPVFKVPFEDDFAGVEPFAATAGLFGGGPLNPGFSPSFFHSW